MLQIQQNTRQLAGRILLMLFVWYFIGITFFPHKHIVNNQVVVHSHPYSGSESHTHTSNVLNLIFQLSNFNTKLFTTGILLAAIFVVVKSVTSIYQKTNVSSQNSFSGFSRPPPF